MRGCYAKLADDLRPTFLEATIVKSMRIFFALILCALALAGCSIPSKFATAEEEATAKGYLDQLKRGQTDEIERAADPSIKTDALPNTLAKMAAQIPAGEPMSTTLVGDNHVSTSSAHMVNLTYEFQYPSRWLLENVAVKTQDGISTIVGMSVVPLAQSLEEQHRFDLWGKTAIEYLYLALAALMPLFTVFALIVCARTRMMGRKWPWVVFVLFGLGKFSINWATGQTAFAPIMFQLFSAAATSAPYSPWIVSFSLPVGALVFLLRRKALMNSPILPAQMPG